MIVKNENSSVIFYNNFQYNFHSNNKNSVYYVCRKVVNGKQFGASITTDMEIKEVLKSGKKVHQHSALHDYDI